MFSKLVVNSFDWSRHSSATLISLIALALIVSYGLLAFWLLSTPITDTLALTTADPRRNDRWRLTAEAPVLNADTQRQGQLKLTCNESIAASSINLPSNSWQINSSGFDITVAEPLPKLHCNKNALPQMRLTLTRSLLSIYISSARH